MLYFKCRLFVSRNLEWSFGAIFNTALLKISSLYINIRLLYYAVSYYQGTCPSPFRLFFSPVFSAVYGHIVFFSVGMKLSWSSSGEKYNTSCVIQNKKKTTEEKKSFLVNIVGVGAKISVIQGCKGGGEMELTYTYNLYIGGKKKEKRKKIWKWI